MHITAEDIIVEIVDRHGVPLPCGEAGEIVVTHLSTGEFPGDIGIPDDGVCRCGRGLPLLREIQGQSTDFVVAQDGTIMHGLALIYILRDLPEIRSFKIIQESINTTRVCVVSERGLPPQTARKIEQEFKARLGKEIDIQIEEMRKFLRKNRGSFGTL